ncbi:nuclear transport factor 2 family protein [Streptomyces bambusae]|uniref:nuclear transport factor 2 family protein n=1 Tax=Streptomyces bambusae TaxID=1550616 RepID=UPI001CFE9417|nr:nuclear transport factor 2 family protein [Streptomyces bambusae]MCB5164911.1 nuclear transport factor 2 family protein [Streptomyces bambusae]
MSQHPDAALIRRGYEAFVKGDMDTLSTLMTADVIHHVPGTNPLSGHHKGREAVLDLYRRLGEETRGTMRVELEKVMVDGRGHGISVHCFKADRGDRGMELHQSLFFTIVGGKITDIDACTEDIAEEDAFWS